MFEIKYKIEDDISIQSFELKNVDIVFTNSCYANTEYPMYFKIFKNNVDLSYLSKRHYWFNPVKINHIKETFIYKNESVKVETPIFFFFDDLSGNYLHYFLESFPKINYFLRLKEKIPNLKLAMPDYVWNTSFIRESISLYFNNDLSDILILNDTKNYECDLVYIPSNIYLWPDKLNFSNIIFDSFKKLSDKVSIDDEKEGVYISRQDIVKRKWWHDRHLKNELELIEKIKTDLNYDIIELYDLDVYNKIKIFKTYKNIVQTSGAAMINLLGCNPLTNFHIISHPSYSWSNLFLKNAADKLNVNFYEYNFGKLYGDVQSKCEQFDGNLSNINKPWEIINIQNLIDKLKR
jgi:hypothetical protein